MQQTIHKETSRTFSKTCFFAPQLKKTRQLNKTLNYFFFQPEVFLGAFVSYEGICVLLVQFAVSFVFISCVLVVICF